MVARSPRSGWDPCPQGELRRLAARLTARRQRRRALTVMLGAALAVAAGVAAVEGTVYLLDVPGAGRSGGACPTPAPSYAPAPAPTPGR